ncbi:hypothetical protein D3C86_1830700 [compost metagenome]
MHDRVRLETVQHSSDSWQINDVGLNEFIASVVGNAGQRFEIASVSQLVQVKHFMAGVSNQLANQGRADETGTAGNEDTHDGQPFQ